jgi:GntR family transcriptional regulator/MocR family aminotransferase
VLVVNSTQQAIDIAARLLLDPGSPAFIEDPCYPSALAALKAAGAKVRGMPVDVEGAVTDSLPGNAKPGLVYVTPSHQFPLGMTMSLSRRLSLLNWASRTGSHVLEDDYDSEFRHDGRPITALQGLDSCGRVLYIGTFNKILFPGLRLAYLIVPSGLARAFASARRIIDGYSPPLPQAVLAGFMASGHFASYLRLARLHFRACRDAVVKAVEKHWGDSVELGPSSTGLHVVALFPPGTDDVRLARQPVRGINIAPLSRYYSSRKKPAGILIGYGTATREEIEPEIGRLASLVRS